MSILHRNLRKQYPTAVRGEGVFLIDDAGKRYLDFSGSAAVNFIGHGVKQVGEAIKKQAAELEFVHSSQFTTQTAERFAAELIDFCGPAFAGGKVFLTSGGSEAVETALKLVRQYQVEAGQPNRFRIISRHHAYHGATLGALAASGNVRRRKIYLPLVKEPEAFLHIGMPYCYRCAYRCADCAAKYAKELELALAESRGTAAAFIAEPMSGATLGAAAPPVGYFEQVAELCRNHGILFVADEVMTGWGRTGRNLAMEHFGAVPDIIVLAKGLTSGYLPLGAVIATKKIVDALQHGSGSLTHGFTYNGHPLSTAAGETVLRVMKTQKLVERAAVLEATMQSQLSTLLELDCVGDVRGKGLLWGVEFVADKATKAPIPGEINFAGRVTDECFARGVLVYPMQGSADGTLGDHLLIAPPAIITEEQIATATHTLAEAIKAAVA